MQKPVQKKPQPQSKSLPCSIYTLKRGSIGVAFFITLRLWPITAAIDFCAFAA